MKIKETIVAIVRYRIEYHTDDKRSRKDCIDMVKEGVDRAARSFCEVKRLSTTIRKNKGKAK